jgi:hypothetical protein
MQADAADQAGVFVAARRMADEAGRLVHDEHVGVFVKNGEQGSGVSFRVRTGAPR